MRLSKVRAVVVAVAVCGVTAPVALAGALPTVPDVSGQPSSNQFKVKPSSIQISGDGSFYFDGAKKSHNRAGPLKWTSWTATGGKGSGFNWVNNCKPNCASGTFHQYPVKLHVWRSKTEGGHLIFTRMTVTYTNGHPSYLHHNTVVFTVTHQSGGYFIWNYPS